MSVISEKFPILKNQLAGFFVLVLCAATLVNAWVFQEEVELPKTIAWYLGIGLMLLFFIFTKHRRVLITSKLFLLVSGSFILSLILSSLFSMDRINSLFGVFPRYTNSVIFFVSWLVLIAILGVFERQEKYSFAKVLVFLAGLISLWGIIQTFGLGYYGGLHEGVRTAIPSFLGNPNFASMFVVTTVPLQIWLLHKHVRSKSFMYYFSLLAVNLVGLMVFNSRGALLALVAAVALSWGLLLYRKSYKTFWITLAVAALAVAAIGSFYSVTRVNTLAPELASTDQSTSNRWLVWEIAFDAVIDRPLTGSGVGNYFLLFRSSTNSALTNTEWFDDAHNVVLHIFSSAGIPFGLCWLLLIGAAAYLSFRRLVREKDAFAGAVGSSILVWLVVGSFTPVTLPNWILLGVLVGIGWGYADPARAYILSRKSKFLVGALAAVFLLVGSSYLLSEIFLWRSSMALQAEQYAKAERYGRNAIRFFPYNLNAVLNMQKALIEQGKYELVDSNFKAFQEFHPLSSGVYQSMADYYVQMYQKTGSAVYKAKGMGAVYSMLGYNGNYEPILRVASLDMLRLGETEKARYYARRAVVYDSSNYNGWMFLANAEYQLGDKNKTIFALEKAFAIQPSRRFKELLDDMKAADNIKSVYLPYDL